MNVNEIKDLIKTVSDSELTVFDYEEGNIKISFRKGNVVEYINNGLPVNVGEINETKVDNTESSVGTTVYESSAQAVTANESNNNDDDYDLGNYVVSPLVGTAYLAPEEGAENFVKVGDVVKKGQTLAIVEAMKLMNEIESEYDGVVKAILVENAKSVEYGQKMFVIE